MYRSLGALGDRSLGALGEGRLTSGERLDLGVVEAPDPEWADRIATFLFRRVAAAPWYYCYAFARQYPDRRAGRETSGIRLARGSDARGVR